MRKIILIHAVLLISLQTAKAENMSRRATIMGGGGASGRCSIEVNVDGAAEVEVFSDVGNLRTLSGQPAYWHRFHCNAPLPHMPHDFRVVRVAGRGSVQLVHDPRGNRGTAVIHFRDPQGGRDRYAVDIVWAAPQNGWPPPGGGSGPGRGSPIARGIQVCQDSVTNRLNRDGYFNIAFERTSPDDNPGRHDWIRGTASARRRNASDRFSFSCSVDFSSGRVRSLNVQRY